MAHFFRKVCQKALASLGAVLRWNLSHPALPGLLAGVAPLLVLLFLPSCAPKEPIHIGFLGGLTGPHYSLGLSGRNGLTLLVEEVNREGGIDGRMLDLVIRDDRQDPARGAAAVEELAREGVVAIVGPMTSTVADAVGPIADRERILLLSPTVTSPYLAGRDDWIVSLYLSKRDGGEEMANFALRDLGLKRVVALLDKSNRYYTEAWLGSFREVFLKGGGEDLSLVPFQSGQVASYDDLVREALAKRPEGILLIANGVDTAAFCQQVRKHSPGIPLLASEWGSTAEVITLGGRAVEGAFFSTKLDFSMDNPRFRAFRAAYRERFGREREADFAALHAYEAGMILVQALRKETSREGIRRYILRTGKFAGLQEDLLIDRNGDAERELFIMTVRDGTFDKVR